MFNDPDMLRKVINVIYPVMAAGVSTQVIMLGKPFNLCISDEKLDVAYNRIKFILRSLENGVLRLRKFPT